MLQRKLMQRIANRFHFIEAIERSDADPPHANTEIVKSCHIGLANVAILYEAHQVSVQFTRLQSG